MATNPSDETPPVQLTYPIPDIHFDECNDLRDISSERHGEWRTGTRVCSHHVRHVIFGD